MLDMGNRLHGRGNDVVKRDNTQASCCRRNRFDWPLRTIPVITLGSHSVVTPVRRIFKKMKAVSSAVATNCDATLCNITGKKR